MNLESLRHVVNMVLADNKGLPLTEALCIGIEQSIVHYAAAIQRDEEKLVKGATNALDS